MTKLQTPAELRLAANVEDMGLEIVHDMLGNDRNLLHEVAIKASDKFGRSMLIDMGYRESCGFRRGGEQWWVWTKDFPLYVREWISTPDYRD